MSLSEFKHLDKFINNSQYTIALPLSAPGIDKLIFIIFVNLKL